MRWANDGRMMVRKSFRLALAATTLTALVTMGGYAHAEEGTQMAATAPDAAAAHAAQTEATRAIAHAFLKTYFIDRDLGAYAKFAKPDFIQHNPGMADGVVAHRAYMDKVFAAPKPVPAPPPQAHVIDMILVDGDLFAAMHHSVNADDSARLFVDIWRVEDGKIAEHWDVIQEIPRGIPHDNGMACGIETYAEASIRPDSVDNPACGKPDPNSSRDQSLAYFQAYVDEVGKGDVISAIEKWFHPAYKQHSPIIADGKQGAIDYLMEEWGKKDAPRPVLGPQRIIAEGDLVLVHYMYRLEGVPGEEAHIDIFRFTDGKMSEHWDVKQKVPEHSANENGMWGKMPEEFYRDPTARAAPPPSKPQTAAERLAYAEDDPSPIAVVNRFNQMAFFDGKPVEAMRRYLADDFIERYPDFAKPDETGTDKEEAIAFFETRGWKEGEGNRSVVYKVIAQGDEVAVFHHMVRGEDDLGLAFVDIFRVENGLIVEHWAVGQPVSPKVSPRHSMF